jgi:galactose mutarotase-like enzyme
VLQDDDQNRAAYPFAFRLEVAYAVEGGALLVTFTVINTGDEVLPASIGAHPAFLWPLSRGIPKTDHRLEFEVAETAPIRRLADGLMLRETFSTPIDSQILRLSEALFAADAIILDHPASRSVRYYGGDGGGIEVSWNAGYPQLRIWSRADADLLCFEPWHGFASPTDFDGEFLDKPGLMLIPAGEQRDAAFRIRLVAN